MRRRKLIVLLGGITAGWSQEAPAQIKKAYRLGSLTPVLPFEVDSPYAKVLLAELARRGYTLGENLTYEARGSVGHNEKLPQLLADFKASGTDVVVTIGYPTALAAKGTGIPIVVMWGAGDPVATGLIESFPRPGGNITGISDVATELSTKRLSLLHEWLPQLRRIAVLWNRDDLGMSLRYAAAEKVARSMGIIVQELGVREQDDFNGVFEAMDREPPDAILMVSDQLTNLNRQRVFDYAAAKRLPAIYEYDFLARAGGLMSYGPDLTESIQRAADLVDRIFKGAKPSELPFELPTRYSFVINQKTATALGLTIPPTLLASADEVIE